MENIKDINVSKADLAELIGVNPNTITKYIRDGMPTVSQKAVNLQACVRWLIERANQKQGQSQSDARTKLIEAQTRRIKLQILEKRGDLVEVEHVKFQIQKTIEQIKNRITTITTKLPPKLVGKTQVQITEIMKADIAKTLSDLKVDL